MPAIEEANQISITLDKKVMFKAISVSPEARFEFSYDYNTYIIRK